MNDADEKPIIRERHSILLALSILQYVMAAYALVEAICYIPSVLTVLPFLVLPYEEILNQGEYEFLAALGIDPHYLGVVIVTLIMAYLLLKWYLIFAAFAMGQTLQRAEHYGKCLLISGLECLLFPWGTLVGGLTFVALLLPPVRDQFYYDYYEEPVCYWNE